MIPTREQQAVIDAPHLGPHVVDAGAGTGKTFTLVERAASLVAAGTLEPHQLLVVTFTHAAAAEIAGRLETRFAAAGRTGRPNCGTFHQIARTILREFAYETGTSPDIRAVDDARARGVFAAAFCDLLAGRLGVDTSALPLLDRVRELERNLAKIALRLKSTNRTVQQFEAGALRAADDLERLTYGAIQELKQNGQPRAGWPRPNPPLTDEQRAAEAARERLNVRAVAALFRRFDERLADEHLLTFGDVLTRAAAMLRSYPSIAATLRERWQHAMVDEFQDTNPIQVDFLKALFGDDLRPVMAVGDVRQAIYAFNGANPDGIVQFRTMPSCASFPLTENRRSYAPILEAAHHVLARANAVPPELHTPLAAHRGGSDRVAVRTQRFDGADALEREADAVARTIRGLADDGVSPRAIAVLLRSRTKAPVFAAALHRYGLAVQLHGGAGFFGAVEIRDVVAWLRLVEEPGDVSSLVTALQSAAIGLGDGSIALLAAGGDFARAALVDPLDAFSEAERDRLLRFRAIAKLVANLAAAELADAVRTVVFESGGEIARIGGDPGELDQVRANLDKFVRLAANFAADRPTACIADFLTELDERAELEDDEAEAELDGERIAMMTVHAAKGLEWDHVFVANVSPRSFPVQAGDARDTVVRFDEHRGALAFMYAVDGRTPLRWHLASNAVDEISGTVVSRPKDEREEHRLFYVALTRARDVIYVTGCLPPPLKAGSVCFDAVSTWLSDCGIDPATMRLVDDETPPPALAAQPTLPGIDIAQLTHRLEAQLAREALAPEPASRRGLLSYTAIALHEACPRRSRYHYVLGLPDLIDEAPALPGEGDHRESPRRDPARFGRVVHLVLESVALARIAGKPPDIEFALNAALEEEECSGDAALRDDARRAVDAALIALSPFTPVAAEERFDVEIDGVPLYGYIDLLARNAAGELMIVDYKTGTTPSEHYAMQFALYQRAIRERYPEAAQTLLLRIETDRAALEAVIPASHDALAAAIAAAHSMDSDEPRPGAQCRTCPYAQNICDAAARPASIAQ